MTDWVTYESQLSRPAAQFVITLPRRHQRLVLDLADQIARQPFGVGDYQTQDITGRTVENYYWMPMFLLTGWIIPLVRCESLKS